MTVPQSRSRPRLSLEYKWFQSLFATEFWPFSQKVPSEAEHKNWYCWPSGLVEPTPRSGRGWGDIFLKLLRCCDLTRNKGFVMKQIKELSPCLLVRVFSMTRQIRREFCRALQGALPQLSIGVMRYPALLVNGINGLLRNGYHFHKS